MAAVCMGEGIHWVGALNPNMRIFDVVMKTDNGTSYNAYLVRGQDKTALIDTCHGAFYDAFIENIRQVCPVDSIDYIIMNHCEPDHSGALARLLEACPGAKLLATQAGALYLKNITNREDLPIQRVKDGEEIDLGGKTLRFIAAPFLHWPDSMFTYCPQARTAFTCDFLGSHYCEPYMRDSDIAYPGAYQRAFKLYFDAIFGPFLPYVRAGLGKLKALDVDTVCPSHGPVLHRGCQLENAMEAYAQWSAEQKRGQLFVPIFYCSAYGNTARLAQAIAGGIRQALPDADVQCLDINDNDGARLAAAINTCDAFAIGTPTINADAVAPVWQLLAQVDAIHARKKPVLAFGSYGWSGEAVGNICARLSGLKCAVFGEGLKVCFVPSEQDIQRAGETGYAFGQAIAAGK
nr:FprA family A-type flavoprotein [bacterium]